ncbi:MAG: methionine--tRNA ligase subunit beta, partial [Candidatus Marinimicrobia bacterium CG_4_9_14_3_um_filter_48_9]
VTRAGAILYTCGEALRLAASALHPVMPGKIEALFRIFGIPESAFPNDLHWFEWGFLKAGDTITPVEGLFPRIEVDILKKPDTAVVTPEHQIDPIKPEIGFEEFEKLDLRVVKILAAEKHPNADRLLKLQVDLGSEKRQVIAGIADHFKPEDLVGKLITIIANLKPAKIRGEISQGMILAADDGVTVAPLSPTKIVAPGSKIR